MEPWKMQYRFHGKGGIADIGELASQLLVLNDIRKLVGWLFFCKVQLVKCPSESDMQIVLEIEGFPWCISMMFVGSLLSCNSENGSNLEHYLGGYSKRHVGWKSGTCVLLLKHSLFVMLYNSLEISICCFALFLWNLCGRAGPEVSECIT